MNLKSKFLGGMIGSALGDCIGELAFFTNDRDVLLNQVEKQKIITYTDDTAMAIGLAESIIANNGTIDCDHLGKTFHENYNNEPYRGYASGPPTIFRIVEQTRIPYIDIAKGLFRGSGSFGNGASMRIAPLGLFFYDAPNIYDEAKKSAIVTHSHLLGIEGAAILAKAISYLVLKNPINDKINNTSQKYLDNLIDYSRSEEYRSKLKSIKQYLIENISINDGAIRLGANVTALGSVPFSIFAFLKNPFSFKDCLLDTVLVSEDRDTIGAMVGGLLGGYLGIEAIPLKWIQKLENLDYIKKLVNNLIKIKN